MHEQDNENERDKALVSQRQASKAARRWTYGRSICPADRPGRGAVAAAWPVVAVAALLMTTARAQGPRVVSGVYPHLAMFNDEGECGTGAVVPWAGRLWVVTYAPHKPRGSSDKLY